MNFLKTGTRSILRFAGLKLINLHNAPVGLSVFGDIYRDNNVNNINTIFDIGANKGQTVTRFKEHFKESTIYSFEPVHNTFAELERNIKKYKNVKPYNLAFGDSVGDGEIFLQNNSELNSINPKINKPNSHANNASVSIKIDTVDNFCTANKIQKIDILKIDTEGNDLKVLHGATHMFSKQSVLYVLVEVGFQEDNPRHIYFDHINRFLTDKGFKLRAFYQSVGKKSLFLRSADALFVLK
jgi:FkbM family methyltransferase